MTEEEIATLKKANDDLVARVQQLESINTDLVGQKKELKSKLEEGLSDAEAKAEIDNLRALLDGTEAEKAELQSTHSAQINAMRMKDALRGLGVNAQNNDAFDNISNLVLDGATFDDGFKWVGEDGATKYNTENKPYSIQDRINELKESEKSYLFAPAKGGGGGNPAPSTADEKPSINSIIDAGLKY